MVRKASLLLLVCTLFALSGCFKKKVVLDLQPDGSGAIDMTLIIGGKMASQAMKDGLGEKGASLTGTSRRT